MELYESASVDATAAPASRGPSGGGDRRARAEAWLEIGIGLLRVGDNPGAREALEKAAMLAPTAAVVRTHLAIACARGPDKAAAEEHARAALELDPEAAYAAHLLGTLLCEREQVAEGLIWLKFAGERLPESGQVLRDLGAVQLFVGDIPDARANFLRALELEPEAVELTFAVARMVDTSTGSDEARRVMAVLTALEARADLPAERRIEVLYALGKAWEDQGEYDRAFSAYAEGARLKRSTLTYSIEREEARLQAVIETFDGPLLETRAGSGVKGRRRPVFIVGMPRSGTTLVAQILGAHPEVQSAGETPALMNLVAASRGRDGSPYPAWAHQIVADDRHHLGVSYLRSLPPPQLGRTVITDKRLENIAHLGLANLLLDEAVYVHVRRDPRDALFACFAMLFSEGQEYSYDFAELARYWRVYERLMAHWAAVLPSGRMLEVDYDALVADPEPWSRRLVAHVGLDWDEACARPHEARRVVRSASAAQVREPIHQRGVGRWRPFARQLKPLFDQLGLVTD